jgi:3-oxoacyl-[acyl-carrier protein] reductase
MNLNQKAVLITRAIDPLGRGIAGAMAAAGANVVVSHHGQAETAATLVTELQQQGRQAFALEADLTDPAQAQSLVAATVNLLGQLDIAIILPHRTDPAPFMEQTLTDWLQVLNRNVAGMLYPAQAAAQQMIARQTRGRLIFLSSVVSEMPVHQTSQMGTSLAAVNWLAKCAALELGAYGITVNVVSPGWIDPGQDDASLCLSALHSADAAGREYIAQGIPLHRLGTSNEVGQVCSFLASDVASYVTGVYLPVDGGYAIAKTSGNTPYPDSPPWPSFNANFDFSDLLAENHRWCSEENQG